MLIVSDSPLFSTGYANIARNFALSLPQDIDIAFASLQHMPGMLRYESDGRSFRHYGCNPPQKLEEAVTDFEPDLVVHIRDVLAHVQKWYPPAYSIKAYCRDTDVWGWVPAQHLIIPWEFADACMREYDLTLTFTKAGVDAMGNAGMVRNTLDYLVPGISSAYSSPEGPAADVGRKNIPLVVSIGVHDSPRKMFPLLAAAYKKVMGRVDLDFYLHTYQAGAYDLPAHINETGTRGHWLFPYSYFKEKGVDEAMMARIYRRANAYVSVGSGEGLNMPCLPPDEKIMTYNGLRPISDVHVGDMVLTHMGRFRKVTKTFARPYSGPIVNIRARNYYRPIRLTPEHPILAIHRPPRQGHDSKMDWNDPGPEWIPAVQLAHGDGLVAPTPVQLFNTDSQYTSPLAEVFGWYIAEGCSSSKQGIVFVLNGDKEQDVAVRLDEQMRILFGLHSKIAPNPRTKALRLYGSNWILGTLFPELCGDGALNKHMPRQVLYGPEEPLRVMLDAIGKGDGHMRGGCIQYSTSSEQLAHDLMLSMYRLGRTPAAKLYIRQNSRFHHTPEFTIYYYPNGYRDRVSGSGRRSMRLQVGHTMHLVGGVATENYSGTVHNLEVEEDNSYVDGVFAVHNCMEASAMGRMVIFPDFANNMEVTEGVPGKLRRPVKTHVSPVQAMAWESIMDIDDLAAALEAVPAATPDPEAGRRYYEQHKWANTAERFVSMAKGRGLL